MRTNGTSQHKDLVKEVNALKAQLKKLEAQHPDADTELRYRDAFELLVATILSAQSTDQRVNLVTPELFKRYPNARAMAKATAAITRLRIITSVGSGATWIVIGVSKLGASDRSRTQAHHGAGLGRVSECRAVV